LTGGGAWQYWVQVHVGCTLLQILQHKHHVVAATLPALHVFARDTTAHAEFRRANAGKIKELLPKA
jgi:hypothetical protein